MTYDVMTFFPNSQEKNRGGQTNQEMAKAHFKSQLLDVSFMRDFFDKQITSAF